MLKLHVSGFPRVFTWYSRMLLTSCSSAQRSFFHHGLLVQHHTDTDDCTRTFGISPQIPAQGPFTFMWLMSRVFKAARSSLKLYYHWFPWKHDDETFYYSQCFMGCLLRSSTEHLPRTCSQVKPLIKRRSEFLEMLGIMESFHFSKWMLMSV